FRFWAIQRRFRHVPLQEAVGGFGLPDGLAIPCAQGRYQCHAARKPGIPAEGGNVAEAAGLGDTADRAGHCQGYPMTNLDAAQSGGVIRSAAEDRGWGGTDKLGLAIIAAILTVGWWTTFHEMWN